MSSVAKTLLAFVAAAIVANAATPLEDLLRRSEKIESRETLSAIIKQIRVTGESSGFAVLDDQLLYSSDNGASWTPAAFAIGPDETVAGVFGDRERFIVAVAMPRAGRLIIGTSGEIQFRSEVELVSRHREDATLDRVEFLDAETFRIRLASSSNFERSATYGLRNGVWLPLSETDGPGRADGSTSTIEGENIIAEASFGATRWFLTSNGRCEGFKTGCWQETRIRTATGDITPALVRERTGLAKANARLEAERSVFAQPPGGNTRISINRGFDKCTAATSAQMQIWWDYSYFYDANIYMSGRNRGCSQPQLTAAWVDAVANQGWGLIPTIVGYQSPCSVCTTCQKHSSDPPTAEQQGRGEADIAVNDAIALGLTAGTVLYYDMERYDDLSGTGACSTPTKAFLKGWTDRVKELGFKSGVYGSPTNAVGDWLSIPEPSRMDAVWLARWDNVMSVWVYNSPSPVVPESAWGNHQRIKQWQAPHNETWGGVTFNIDGNIADGPVASKFIAKNRRADYDGDGKSDISVWRPSSGVWYVSNSATPTFYIQAFGIATDVIAPGDYDGDGKTDLAVFRPDSGVWHIYSRSIYTAYQLGAVGDVPVPADYDGDGRTDIAVYRPSTGVWYIKNSLDSRGTSFTIQAFGLAGDLPVPDDFDGDGRADAAIFRPSDGVWHLLRSSAGYTAVQFGLPGDRPVQADYDGDGKSDLGIFRPSTGVWYLYRSQAGVASLPFGLTGDVPAAGDYDGDGKYDIAVFRPGTGVWYLWQSTAGFGASQFGQSGDKPVESGYTPQN